MTQPRPARLLVLLSGSGRTLANLIERIQDRELDAEIPLVLANRECRGLDIARDAGIPAELIDGGPSAETLDAMIRELAIDWIVLAGYLKLLPITDAARGRVINIHPSLLPQFGGPGMHGMRVHRAVVEAARRGDTTESGCTVHFADDEYDTGATILQRRCPVHTDDTPEQLAQRVFDLELEALPEALSQLIRSQATSAP